MSIILYYVNVNYSISNPLCPPTPTTNSISLCQSFKLCQSTLTISCVSLCQSFYTMSISLYYINLIQPLPVCHNMLILYYIYTILICQPTPATSSMLLCQSLSSMPIPRYYINLLLPPEVGHYVNHSKLCQPTPTTNSMALCQSVCYYHSILHQSSYTIPTNLHYVNPSILCQSSYTRMLITSYTTVTINQRLSGIFCSYSTYYFAIFVIIFIFQTQRHTLFLSVIVSLRHFYLNHNKMNAKKSLQSLQHANKNWYLQFGSLSFGDKLNPSTQSIYISQIITHFVSTLENRSLRYTSCQLQAFIKCSFNYFPSLNNIMIKIATSYFMFPFFHIDEKQYTMYFFVNWKKIAFVV